MDWWYQFPPTTLKTIVIPPEAHAEAAIYVGEARKILFQVKTLRKTGKLDQYKMTRFFTDGTVITAHSFFGNDIVTIDVSARKEIITPSCIVTLYNLPEVVPPMMWYAPGEEIFTKVEKVWEIRKPNGDLEIEGKDYFKTYYSYSVDDCPLCSSLDFTLGQNIGVITGSETHRPFIYKSEKDDGTLIYKYQGAMVPHFMGYDWTIPPVPPDPLNHTIYSFWGHAEAEIIKMDVDEGGTYFLWKAYTEWSNMGPYVVDFTRTGLGYMLMRGFIENEGGILCASKPFIIKVDCCEKPIEERQIKLWYEYGSGPFMYYGSMVLYEVPAVIRLWQDFYYYACTPGGLQFYTVPDVNGSCIPIEWTLSGRGTLVVSPHPTDQNASYPCPNPSPYVSPDCADVVITAKDRCGTEDKVTATCCSVITPGVPYGLGTMSIGYTSLAMNVSTSQNLTANGGCPPYSWSVIGGGSIVVDPTRPMKDWATYTSPASNPECANNDGVTVTDCCGSSVSLTLYVSKWSEPGSAYEICEFTITACECYEWYGGNCIMYKFKGSVHHREWDCSGALIHDDTTTYSAWTLCNPISQCPGGACVWTNCTLWGCATCNTLTDIRSAAMKTNGCCPIPPVP